MSLDELQCPEKAYKSFQNSSLKLLEKLKQSELDYHTITNNAPLLIVSTVILSTGLLTNLVVIVLVWKKKNLRSPMNMLLVNMSLGHFLSCISLFVFCYVIDTGKLNAASVSLNFLCGILTDGAGVYFICAGSYLLTLCAISFNRYSAIRFPARQHLRMSKRAVLWFNLVVWFLAAAWVAPSIVSFKYDHVTKLCLRDWKFENPFLYRILALLWSIILPLGFLILSFSVILCKRTEKNMLNNNTRRRMRLQKAEKLLGLLIVTFFFTWTPFFIYWGVYTITDTFSGCIGEYRAMSWMRVAILFSSINSVIDPFLYTVGSREIRSSVLQLVRKMKPVSNRVGSSVVKNVAGVNTPTTFQLNQITSRTVP